MIRFELSKVAFRINKVVKLVAFVAAYLKTTAALRKRERTTPVEAGKHSNAYRQHEGLLCCRLSVIVRGWKQQSQFCGYNWFDIGRGSHTTSFARQNERFDRFYKSQLQLGLELQFLFIRWHFEPHWHHHKINFLFNNHQYCQHLLWICGSEELYYHFACPGWQEEAANASPQAIKE